MKRPWSLKISCVVMIIVVHLKRMNCLDNETTFDAVDDDALVRLRRRLIENEVGAAAKFLETDASSRVSEIGKSNRALRTKFEGPAYGGCCDDVDDLLSCCEEEQSCCPASDVRTIEGVGRHGQGPVFLECCETKTGSVKINIASSVVKLETINGLCCDSALNGSGLSCCDDDGGCCGDGEGATAKLECCSVTNGSIDSIDLTDDKEEDSNSNSNSNSNEDLYNTGDDISADLESEVDGLVQASSYQVGGNRRFTWENLKKEIIERRRPEIKERTSSSLTANEGNPEEREDDLRQKHYFKSGVDFSSFNNMSKNTILQTFLGVSIFVMVTTLIVGANYTKEDGRREHANRSKGWNGVREERDSIYSSAFKAYASV
jgi:hypothetical protein